MRLGRRRLLTGAVTLLGAGSFTASARAQAASLPALPLAFAVAYSERADEKGKVSRVAAVTRAFIDEQLQAAEEIFGAFDLHFREARELRDAGATAHVETRADRDAITEKNDAGVVNIYFVESLRDVDAPEGFRMGVTWRKLSNLKQKAIIVAASARPTTMAHELGHYFGNDHTYVKNNLMSYDRDGGKVTMSAEQAAKARRTAAALFAKKELEKPDA